MKYSMVKQFSNAAFDNMFKFFFKIVDFWKIMYEALWMFIDIWIAFYLIFHNFFMYIYYLFLFIIDRGTDESRHAIFFWRKTPSSYSRTPQIKISNVPNPIPAMYRATTKKTTQAVSAVSETVSKTAATVSDVSDVVFSSTSQGKRSSLKSVAEAIVNFFIALKNFILMPFKAIGNIFGKRMKPVRDKEETPGQKSKSLIDEYLKEYERKRN